MLLVNCRTALCKAAGQWNSLSICVITLWFWHRKSTIKIFFFTFCVRFLIAYSFSKFQFPLALSKIAKICCFINPPSCIPTFSNPRIVLYLWHDIYVIKINSVKVIQTHKDNLIFLENSPGFYWLNPGLVQECFTVFLSWGTAQGRP